ncbi:MAG: CDP-diacylglycerol--serine O-phosphatidyltransferase [Deltaproteobacteria bacterium]|nr:CDP-diacylglycerol--serine O-phosphatidyltransferase [Deltaproteobacteria bacterium]
MMQTRRKRRTGITRGIYLLPNLLTTFGLFLGILAIVKTLHHEFVMASWAIIVAGLCDNLDGRVARLTGSASEFGIEYDSLADLIVFGVAPAILIYSWSLASFPRLGWLVAFLYVACGALRLARYNVQVATVERTYFQGLPIPMAAGMIVCTVLFYDAIYGRVFPVRNWWLIGMTVVLALLMISTCRYRSMKQIRLGSRWSFFALVAVVGIVTLVALQPEVILFVLNAVYLVSGVVESIMHRREQGGASRNDLSVDDEVLPEALQEKIRLLPSMGGGRE